MAELIIDFQTLVRKVITTSGVRVDREQFLKKCFSGKCSVETMEKAIRTNPAMGGISRQLINQASLRILEEDVKSMKKELKVKDAAASVEGEDMIPYMVQLIRNVQKLMYLYGMDQLNAGNGTMDTDTFHLTIVLLSDLFGVRGAKMALEILTDNYALKLMEGTERGEDLTAFVLDLTGRDWIRKLAEQLCAEIYGNKSGDFSPMPVSREITYGRYEIFCKILRRHLMSFSIGKPNYYYLAART